MTPDKPSYWQQTAAGPATRPYEGDRTCDVAVIGGGLTGVTTALLLARCGVSGVLLEAGRLGGGTSGGTTAKITIQHGLKYQNLLSSVGHEMAQAYAMANGLGLSLINELVGELALDCGYERTAAHVYTRDRGRLRFFDEEARALDALGVRYRMEDRCGLPFPVERVIALDDQACLHPLRYLYGLAEALPGDQFPIFERSRVLDVVHGSPCVVRTENGTLRARSVVLATGYPLIDMPGYYFARLHREQSYLLSVAADLDLGGMYITDGEPVHSMRMHRDAGGPRLLLGGFGHPTGRGGDTVLHEEALRNLLELAFDGVTAQPDCVWSAQDCVPADHVPYIGPMSDGTPQIYVATGYAKWGMTTSAAAALLLTSMITGIRHPVLDARDLFSPSRFTPVASAREVVVQGAHTAGSYIGGALATPSGTPGEIEPGDGAVMRVGGDMLAVSRSPAGRLSACGAHCTHMGCPVVWNPAEQSWDCPCHGSRFGPDGDVLEGPAAKPLPLADPEAATP